MSDAQAFSKQLNEKSSLIKTQGSVPPQLQIKWIRDSSGGLEDPRPLLGGRGGNAGQVDGEAARGHSPGAGTLRVTGGSHTVLSPAPRRLRGLVLWVTASLCRT